jgi:hypothetical protein
MFVIALLLVPMEGEVAIYMAVECSMNSDTERMPCRELKEVVALSCIKIVLLRFLRLIFAGLEKPVTQISRKMCSRGICC